MKYIIPILLVIIIVSLFFQNVFVEPLSSSELADYPEVYSGDMNYVSKSDQQTIMIPDYQGDGTRNGNDANDNDEVSYSDNNFQIPPGQTTFNPTSQIPPSQTRFNPPSQIPTSQTTTSVNNDTTPRYQ